MTDWLDDLDELTLVDEVYEEAFRNAETIFRGISGPWWQALIYVAAFLAFALTSYLLARQPGVRGGIRSFLAYVFPRSVYVHRSFGVDVQILIAGYFITPVLALLAATIIAFVASYVSHALFAAFPGHNPDFEWEFWPVVIFTLSIALLSDFSTYVSHALHHKVPWLWQFHAVHHSAEVMTPLTAFRKHPAYELVSKLIDAALLGPFQGVVFFLFAGPVSAVTVLGVNVVFATFQIFGGSLRHSHMWLSFGPVFSRIFISPAQHQIHHSMAKKHWNKNFGEAFAIWDWMFGTLYVPKEREELRFGVSPEMAEQHSNLWRAYFIPLRNSARILRGRAGGAWTGRRPSPVEVERSSD